jgi:type I restriction enzyme R subunit
MEPASPPASSWLTSKTLTQDIHKIVDIFNKRLEVPKYSRMVSFDEIEKNEFNLNLPRKGLNDWQKDELKKKWGTMQIVLSSRSRMERVVSDIIFDFSVKPRLSSERGNAILVASSIYEACKYFALFQKTPFKGKCAVVTSYNPQARDVSKEEIGVNTETDKQFIFNTYTELLKDVEPKPGMTKTETYEEWAKSLFTEQPANMKLLVVVDKLLTGFDAPPCTYLHIDKSMQDHGLFQAICRVNRLDGDDKDFGYIVDYKDLFKKVENAIAVYTSELDRSAGGVDPEVLLQDRVKKGRERLDSALEALKLLCEPVKPPQGEYEYIRYFCGNTEIPTDLQEHEPQRSALYKATATLVRSYANIADELEPAGYTGDEIAHIKKQVQHYLDVREIVRKASGESLDLKPYEADMRHLIDTYIEADEPRKISPFDDMGLLDLIVKTGIANAIAQELGGLKGNKDAISETIENNVRSKIIKEHLTDPAYYEKMSALLDEIIAARKANAIQYEEYLKRVAELAKRVEAGQAEETPKTLNTPGRRALYNNLNHDEGLALKLDEAVRTARPDGWRGVQAREQVVKKALYDVLQDVSEVERIFLIIKAQREY